MTPAPTYVEWGVRFVRRGAVIVMAQKRRADKTAKKEIRNV